VYERTRADLVILRRQVQRLSTEINQTNTGEIKWTKQMVFASWLSWNLYSRYRE